MSAKPRIRNEIRITGRQLADILRDAGLKIPEAAEVHGDFYLFGQTLEHCPACEEEEELSLSGVVLHWGLKNNHE